MNQDQELKRLQITAEFILDLAKSYKATQAEVSAGVEKGFSVTVHSGQLETLEYESNNAVDITVYFNHRKATVSTSDLSQASLKQVVEKACNMAKFTELDSFNGLADKSLMCQKPKDLDLYHPWQLTPEQAIDLALQCESIGLNLDNRIEQSEDVSVSTMENFYCYANSQGFVGCVPSTKHSIEASFIAKEKDHMERDYSFSIVRDAKDLASVETIAQEAVKRSVRRLFPKTLPTQKIPIIFEARTARSLINAFLSAISGGALYRKSSFLLEQIHQPIFPNFVNIREMPHVLKGLYSAPFDTEGVETKTKHFIKDGILTNYILDSYSARKLNMQTTANAGGVFNVLVDSKNLNFDALVKKMDTGVLVTELIGQGTNLVTGDYSRGAFGFWIENGKIQYPVSGFTIAGNLREMFRRIIAISDDIEKCSNVQTGSILLDEMMVAGM